MTSEGVAPQRFLAHRPGSGSSSSGSETEAMQTDESQETVVKEGFVMSDSDREKPPTATPPVTPPVMPPATPPAMPPATPPVTLADAPVLLADTLSSVQQVRKASLWYLKVAVCRHALIADLED